MQEGNFQGGIFLQIFLKMAALPTSKFLASSWTTRLATATGALAAVALSPAAGKAAVIKVTGSPVSLSPTAGVGATSFWDVDSDGSNDFRLFNNFGSVYFGSDGLREADGSNQRGYQEFEPVKSLGRTPAHLWIDKAHGKAVKIVAPLLTHLPPGRPYRIVFVERPIKAVLASQQAMLETSGQASGRPPNRRSERQLASAYLQQVANVGGVLRKNAGTVTLLSVDYDAAVETPAVAAARINRFLGGGLDEVAMAGAVAPGLRRQRIDESEPVTCVQ